jgi:hypothetical protein
VLILELALRPLRRGYRHGTLLGIRFASRLHGAVVKLTRGVSYYFDRGSRSRYVEDAVALVIQAFKSPLPISWVARVEIVLAADVK